MVSNCTWYLTFKILISIPVNHQIRAEFHFEHMIDFVFFAPLQLRKVNSQSSGWHQNLSTLEDLLQLVMSGCLVGNVLVNVSSVFMCWWVVYVVAWGVCVN